MVFCFGFFSLRRFVIVFCVSLLGFVIVFCVSLHGLVIECSACLYTGL